MTQEQYLTNYGKSLIGKYAQCTILTMISNCGQRTIMEPAQKITGFRIINTFMEPTLVVTIGDAEVLESMLRNIKF